MSTSRQHHLTFPTEAVYQPMALLRTFTWPGIHSGDRSRCIHWVHHVGTNDSLCCTNEWFGRLKTSGPPGLGALRMDTLSGRPSSQTSQGFGPKSIPRSAPTWLPRSHDWALDLAHGSSGHRLGKTGPYLGNEGRVSHVTSDVPGEAVCFQRTSPCVFFFGERPATESSSTGPTGNGRL